ncbi:hypothetical protein FQR65_LT06803 [Abscondita terminalis]|nr:hypothetical protein FQR65_LT06803 [Abscondita terminalis]
MIVLVLLLVTVIVHGNPFVCSPDKVYEENKCNLCTCYVDESNILRFTCTLKECSGLKYEFFRRCHPNVPLPCDNCWCIFPYGIICEI